MSVFRNRKDNKRLLGILLLCVLTYTVTPTLWAKVVKEKANCEAYLGSEIPKYHIARQFRDHTEYGSSLTIFLSVDQKDVTRDKLLALSCKLGADHANEESFFLYILDTRRAARRFNPQHEGNDGQTELSNRGFYAFSRRGDPESIKSRGIRGLIEPGWYGQSLGWKPDRNESDRWVEIDLGLPPGPNQQH